MDWWFACTANEKSLTFGLIVPPIVPLYVWYTSGWATDTNGLAPVRPLRRDVRLMLPASGPEPACVITSTKVLPGRSDSAAN